MTTTPEASAQAPASSEFPVRQKLAAAAARAGTRTTRARKTTARKAAPRKPTVSRNDRAAARGKHSARIAPAVKSGAALLSWRNPIAGRVISLQADAWAASLDAVAAEDPRVDALLTRISGFFGKGGAWGEFGKETALMVGGVMVATGRVPLTGPGGMVLAMFAGGLVEQATQQVAYDTAYSEFAAAGDLTADGDPVNAQYFAQRVAEIAAGLLQERADKIAARFTPAADEDGDAPAAPADDAPAPRESVFASWGR
jgi:hypothetical protein